MNMNEINKFYAIMAISLLILFVGISRSNAAEPAGKTWLLEWQKKNPTWRALHLIHPQPEKLDATKELIADYLAPMGINVLILEVNYAFDYTSHPELKCSGLNKEQARELTELCRKHGIRLIPLLNCLGHQSWGNGPAALLDKYPQFEETPPNYTGNIKLYCREWCPSQPEVYKVVNDLLDEMIDAFDADALHVGMDEVFMTGNSNCPLCRGKDPGELFGGVVNKLHQHLVKEKGVEMLMWADRLLDADTIPYGEWEASKTGSHRAIGMIPKDIIMCDWHYEIRKDKDYPSVRFFQQNGFRVLPSTWNRPAAAVDLVRCSYKDNTDKMLGIMFTGWSAGGNGEGILAAFKNPTDSTPAAEKTDSNSKKNDGGRQTADTIKAGLEEIKKLSKK
jgi:hypothetical protein